MGEGGRRFSGNELKVMEVERMEGCLCEMILTGLIPSELVIEILIVRMVNHCQIIDVTFIR